MSGYDAYAASQLSREALEADYSRLRTLCEQAEAMLAQDERTIGALRKQLEAAARVIDAARLVVGEDSVTSFADDLRRLELTLQLFDAAPPDSVGTPENAFRGTPENKE